jgi:hypothetical protein
VGIPTGYTLGQREIILGLGNVSLGITNRFQISTNVLLYLLQIYNGALKYGIYKSESFNMSAGLEFNYLNIDTSEGKLKFTSISPYLAASYTASERWNFHAMGRLSKFTGLGEIKEVDPLGVKIAEILRVPLIVSKITAVNELIEKLKKCSP